MTTRLELDEILLDSMEDTEAALRIFGAIERQAGKRLTEPLAQKIAVDAGLPVRIQRQYGMTYLIFGNGTRWRVASEERNVYIDPAYIREQSTCYLDAAIERNQHRRDAMANGEKLDDLARAIDIANAALKQIKEAIANPPLEVIRHEVKALVNLDLL